MARPTARRFKLQFGRNQFEREFKKIDKLSASYEKGKLKYLLLISNGCYQ